MYKIILGLISLSAFGQAYIEGDFFDVLALEKYEKIEREFENSEFINSYLSKFEISRSVTCVGNAHIRYPYAHNRLIYKATCISDEQTIKLKLKVKYSDSQRTPYEIVKTKITTTR